MKFIKKHSYEITRLIIYQAGMSVFGLILTFASIMSRKASQNPLTLVAGIFASCFYLYLIYAVTWDMGAKDKIRIDAGRQEKDNFLGLKLIAAAQIPNGIVVLVMWLGTIICLGNNGLGNMLFGIGHPIAIFTQGMYLGIITQFLPNESMAFNSAIYSIAIIPSLFASSFGYFFGIKDIRFLTSP